MQDLWQVQHQISAMTSLKKLTKLKQGLQFVLKYERTNENLTKYNCSSCNKTYWSKFRKNNSRIHLGFPIMI